MGDELLSPAARLAVRLPGARLAEAGSYVEVVEGKQVWRRPKAGERVEVRRGEAVLAVGPNEEVAVARAIFAWGHSNG